MPDQLPRLALTLGDPAGIGPEIVARTLVTTAEDGRAVGFAVGDPDALQAAVDACDLHAKLRSVEDVASITAEKGIIHVLEVPASGPTTWGEISAVAGQAALDAIEAATRLALDGQVQGVVTAPIHKEAIWAAGSKHLGHTEFLGALTGSDRVQTMFVVKGLKIFFTTRHMSLRQAIDNITASSVGHAIRESWTSLQLLSSEREGSPKLAVAALNPHGGEGGSFGSEETEHIAPACEAAREEGMDVVGPIPADAVFHQGLEGRFDGVLSHFHDQGHIAAKTLDFEGAITVTMGLPILRTSVDHGTAFDIAGTGRASAGGMLAAYGAAADLAPFAPRLREEFGAGVAARGT